ncbi:hypothetical protein BDY21DRAFT_363857 [Lineolata rhizophorae]|uniref:MIT domain-containing protein n=1 Tax=Lineolata rhizophorae TaxID=578093 RepID=A0A6A6P0M5_9PEZI|nr:hypothetical protein BDY21DRAFT_363857 [Lineolata rhizophorae]
MAGSGASVSSSVYNGPGSAAHSTAAAVTALPQQASSSSSTSQPHRRRSTRSSSLSSSSIVTVKRSASVNSSSRRGSLAGHQRSLTGTLYGGNGTDNGGTNYYNDTSSDSSSRRAAAQQQQQQQQGSGRRRRSSVAHVPGLDGLAGIREGVGNLNRWSQSTSGSNKSGGGSSEVTQGAYHQRQKSSAGSHVHHKHSRSGSTGVLLSRRLSASAGSSPTRTGVAATAPTSFLHGGGVTAASSTTSPKSIKYSNKSSRSPTSTSPRRTRTGSPVPPRSAAEPPPLLTLPTLPRTVYDPTSSPSSAASATPSTAGLFTPVTQSSSVGDYFTAKTQNASNSSSLARPGPQQQQRARGVPKSPLRSPPIITEKSNSSELQQQQPYSHTHSHSHSRSRSRSRSQSHSRKPSKSHRPGQSSGNISYTSYQAASSSGQHRSTKSGGTVASSSANDHAPSHQRDRSISNASSSYFGGEAATPSSAGTTPNRGGGNARERRERDKKTMLSRALAKANTAVLLDNAQNFEGATEAYADACRLLQQVMLRSTGEDDKRKLESIRTTYSNRIAELQQLMVELQRSVGSGDGGAGGKAGKSLPARPMSNDSSVESDEHSRFNLNLFSAGGTGEGEGGGEEQQQRHSQTEHVNAHGNRSSTDDEHGDGEEYVAQTATVARIVPAAPSPAGSGPTPPVKEPPVPKNRPPPIPIHHSQRDSVITSTIREIEGERQAGNGTAAPITGQNFLPIPRESGRNSVEHPVERRSDLESPMDRSYMPAPLSPRRPSSPMTYPDVQPQHQQQHHQHQYQQDNTMYERQMAREHQQQQHYPPHNAQFGRYSDESMSWLDTIEESGGSSCSSSVHSLHGVSMRRKHLRSASGATEAEFDAALDAAVEAAYDEGFEPYEDDEGDADDDDDGNESRLPLQQPDPVAVSRRNVELAKEKVREAEREEAVREAKMRERERLLRSRKEGSLPHVRDSVGVMADLMDDEADEEERMLDEMTKEYLLDGFDFELQSKSALPPRESGSSGFSGSTWSGGSMSSSRNTAGTSLTTVAEAGVAIGGGPGAGTGAGSKHAHSSSSHSHMTSNGSVPPMPSQPSPLPPVSEAQTTPKPPQQPIQQQQQPQQQQQQEQQPQEPAIPPTPPPPPPPQHQSPPAGAAVPHPPPQQNNSTTTTPRPVSVQNRRMSGQNMKQLKIETSVVNSLAAGAQAKAPYTQQPTIAEPPDSADTHPLPPLPKSATGTSPAASTPAGGSSTSAAGTGPVLLDSVFRGPGQSVPRLNTTLQPSAAGTPSGLSPAYTASATTTVSPATPALAHSATSTEAPASPGGSRVPGTKAPIRKNKSSLSLKNRALSISSPDGSEGSAAGTPTSTTFANFPPHSAGPVPGRKGTGPSLAPTPSVPTFNPGDGPLPSGGMHLFSSDIHSPHSPHGGGAAGVSNAAPGGAVPGAGGAPAVGSVADTLAEATVATPDGGNAPIPLEPCPDAYLLRPFWLMRALYQTIAHPRGGYLSNKLFVPRDVWGVKGVKIRNVEEKVAQCDLLTAALQKLAAVDTLDADAVLDEMQALEGVLDMVQATLSKKLGSEVGVAGVAQFFKDAPQPGGAGGGGGSMWSATSGQDSPAGEYPPDLGAAGFGGQAQPQQQQQQQATQNLPKSATQNKYFASWRKLRGKNSGVGLAATFSGAGSGAGGTTSAASSTTNVGTHSSGGSNGGGNGGSGTGSGTGGVLGGANGELPRDALTLATLPMTRDPKVRLPKREVEKVECVGVNANYMGALARLFDSVQVLDQIARQVEDPGLKHSSQTHVGLELSTRHAAEFFAFYICRFVLTDVAAMLDKFIKRGSEWVLV